MAIDSEDKRRSVPGIAGIPYISNVPPVPDGSLDTAADRQHIAGFYRGITVGLPMVRKSIELLLWVYP